MWGREQRIMGSDKTQKRRNEFMNKTLAGVLSFMFAMFSFASPVFADTISGQATVGSYFSADCIHEVIDWGSLTHNTDDNAAPNQLTGLYNSTIDTNQVWDYTVASSEPTVGALTWDSNGASLSVELNAVAANLLVGSSTALDTTWGVSTTYFDEQAATSGTVTYYHGYWLDVAQYQDAATYAFTVTETYLVD